LYFLPKKVIMANQFYSSQRKTMKKSVKTTAWISAAVLVSGLIYGYWRYASQFPSTDDAYVNANIININANISGQVDKLLVHDNQLVKKGQLLYTIDARPYHIALRQARASLRLTEEQIDSAKEAVIVAREKVKEAQAHLELDEKNAKRTEVLVKDGRMPVAQGDSMKASLTASKANLTAAKSQYQQALINLGKPGRENAKLQNAIANLKDAKLKLGYTRVYAPADGKITKLSLRSGNFVLAGQSSFALIESHPFWVDANFKETQLSRIKQGQAVTVDLDMYPGVHFKGKVESISGGTGNSFSLLPQENASGNWVKVTQRVPVRIALVNPQKTLAIGASAYVTVDTRQ